MKKISTRFAILMALAGIVPLLAYGAASVRSLRTVAQQQVHQSNLDTASRVRDQIHLYVSSSIRILKAVAADMQQTGLQRWQQERILKNYVLEFPEFAELTLLDDHGHVIVTSRLGTPRAELPGSGGIAIDGALISEFTIDNDLLPTADVAVHVEQGAERIWLLGRLNLEQLWRIVDRIRIGEEGFALVVTGEGRLLAHGNPDQKSSVANGDNMLGHPLVATLPNSAVPDRPVTAEYEMAGTLMLGAAATLTDLDWIVIVEQPSSQAFAFANSQQMQLAFSIGVALLAMLTVGYFWGRSFINPIQRLTRSTRILASGNLEERVVVDSQDELGQLGTAFNNMAGRLEDLQEDVKKKERQAMFGRVAVGLVHDLSNPIQNIGNACKMIVMMFDDLDYRESFKRTVERELVQVKRMLDDLRNVAKPVPLEKFPIDINKALAEVAESMQTSAAGASLTLRTELMAGQLFIQGDLFALNRVYRNLITNAFQATAPQGSVTIRTTRDETHATVQIADTGSGIPAERLATIFDDFVTTKKRGLGLGLAISRKVVEQLDGTIAVASQVGQGTTFTLRFPLTKERPEQRAAS